MLKKISVPEKFTSLLETIFDLQAKCRKVGEEIQMVSLQEGISYASEFNEEGQMVGIYDSVELTKEERESMDRRNTVASIKYARTLTLEEAK